MSASHLSSLVMSALTALSISASAAAQTPPHRLLIRVLDPADHPVPGATVVASTRDARVRLSGMTTRDGTLQLDGVAADFVVEVSAAGFADVAHLVRAGRMHSSAEIRLHLARLTEQVTVTASGNQQTAFEVAKAVGTVDRAEITARHEFTVADAVRTVPGVSVQQLGGAGAFASIRLRGLRERDTAVLIDGVRFRDAASPQGEAADFIGELHIIDLDRIEVLRGSGSALYGSHAIGGAVNLITAEGGAVPAGTMAAEAGALGFARGAAHAGGSIGAGRLRYTAGAAHTRTTGLDSDDDARNTSVQARGDVRLSAAAHATLRTYASDAGSALNASPAAIGPLPADGFVTAVPLVTFAPSANDPDSRRDSAFVSALLRLRHRPGARFGYTASLHRLTTRRTFVDGPQGAAAFQPPDTTRSEFEGLVHTFETTADLDWSARHVTTLGYELERERYVGRSMPGDPAMAWRADLTQDSHAAWLQQQLRFETVQLTGGFRVQTFSVHRAAFDPVERAPFRGAALTTPPAAVTADLSASRWVDRTHTKIRAHVGNAYRSPAMFERAGASFDDHGYAVFGDPRLEPERSIAVDAGVDQLFAGDRIQTAVTWFHTRLTRVIAFESLDSVTDPFGRAFGYRNADGRAASGLELGARINPTRAMRLNLSYMFADAGPPVGNRDGLPRAAAVSAHQFSALAVQQIGRGLQLSFELEAAGDHYVTLFEPVSFGSRAYGFDGLVKADVAATYSRSLHRRARLHLHGIVENLFDRAYFVQGFRTPGRTVRAGARVTF